METAATPANAIPGKRVRIQILGHKKYLGTITKESTNGVNAYVLKDGNTKASKIALVWLTIIN